MRSTRIVNKVKNRQAGVVLVISLVFLTLLTMIGVSAIKTTSLQGSMAKNTLEQNMSFQTAESALREGERWLGDLLVLPVVCVAPPCLIYEKNMNGEYTALDHTWWMTNGEEYGVNGVNEFDKVLNDPRYVVEHQDFLRDSLTSGQVAPSGMEAYRVIARGTGGEDETQTILESTFTRRFN